MQELTELLVQRFRFWTHQLVAFSRETRSLIFWYNFYT